MNKEMILGTIANGKTQLVGTFSAVPDDKLTWRPLDQGRSALDLFSEAAQTAAMVEKLVTSKGEATISPEMFGQMRQERASWTKEDALTAMETNHGAMMQAIMKLNDADLGVPITMEIGGGMTLPLAGWTMMSYRTYVSRFAQINYIQTLYGDMDSH